MPEELSLAIQQICEEKGLTPEEVKATIEDALAAAFRKDFGDKKTQNIRVIFELATGKFKVFDVKEVVEDELKEKYDKIKQEIEKLKEQGKEVTPEMIEEITLKHKNIKTKKHENTDIKDIKDIKEKSKKDEKDKEKKDKTLRLPLDKLGVAQGSSSSGEDELEKRFNPRTMISLKEAKEIGKKYKIGDEVINQLEVPAAFGRMAAQTAKQVIIQKLREAERDTIYNEYKAKVSELIVGTVQRQEGKIILVDLGNTSAIILPPDQVRTDKYLPGARMKFYIKSVEQTNKGPEILVSRSHPEILRKLFKLEVPEISTGAVVIKAIARDAGARSKVAVMAKEENLDPIGSCIGQRGTRVQTIINELGGEKIDIIEWDEDLSKFITNALAPAKVLKVEIDEEKPEKTTDLAHGARSDKGSALNRAGEPTRGGGSAKTARAYVKEDQYSLAIGKGGQNVRLAAQLAGVRIDVVMEGGDASNKGQETLQSGGQASDKEEGVSEKRKVTRLPDGQESEKLKDEEKNKSEEIKEIKI